MRAGATVVHVQASLTRQSAECRYHSAVDHCGVNAQEVLAASDREPQAQCGPHSGRGQTFEAVKHIPFPTGNHFLCK